MATEDELIVYRFRVTGFTQSQTFLPTALRPFDETFDIEGEHPAQALERLTDEIEWGILESECEFTVSFLGPVPQAGVEAARVAGLDDLEAERVLELQVEQRRRDKP